MQPNFVVKLFKGFVESSRDIDVFPHFAESRDDDLLRRREGTVESLQLPPRMNTRAKENNPVRETVEAELLAPKPPSPHM
jgi:hypothetical protein